MTYDADLTSEDVDQLLQYLEYFQDPGSVLP